MTKGRILLGALKYRNFRLFFFGQRVSLIGTWLQQVAMIWLVYQLSNSAFLLGLVGFCSQIPSFFLAPVAGVYTDRWNRHRTILVTQALSMGQAMILAVLTLTGMVAVWHVLTLGVCLGLVTAFDIPARQAFLIQNREIVNPWKVNDENADRDFRGKPSSKRDRFSVADFEHFL